MASEPQIGDKVIVIGGRPGSVWEDRTGIVVDLPTVGNSNYEICTPRDNHSPWYCPGDKLRVTEHATYHGLTESGTVVITHGPDEPLPAGMAWTAEDEAAWRNRQRLLNSPPFRSLSASQFVSGFQQTTHDVEHGWGCTT